MAFIFAGIGTISLDVNRSSQSRRAFSVCYMDARTLDSSGEKFNTVFGEGALASAV